MGSPNTFRDGRRPPSPLLLSSLSIVRPLSRFVRYDKLGQAGQSIKLRPTSRRPGALRPDGTPGLGAPRVAGPAAQRMSAEIYVRGHRSNSCPVSYLGASTGREPGAVC
jgi:hypothetical protein